MNEESVGHHDLLHCTCQIGELPVISGKLTHLILDETQSEHFALQLTLSSDNIDAAVRERLSRLNQMLLAADSFAILKRGEGTLRVWQIQEEPSGKLVLCTIQRCLFNQHAPYCDECAQCLHDRIYSRISTTGGHGAA